MVETILANGTPHTTSSAMRIRMDIDNGNVHVTSPSVTLPIATPGQDLFLAFWLSVILFLFSSNSGTIDPIDGTPFAMVDWNSVNQWLIVFYIFGLLWYCCSELG